MITVKRIPAMENEEPCFKIYDGSSLVKTEEIGGREDVQPAFLRVVDFVQKTYHVEIYRAKERRDSNKRLTWVSDIGKSKDAPKTTLVSEAKPVAKAAETKPANVVPMTKKEVKSKLQQSHPVAIAARATMTPSDVA